MLKEMTDPRQLKRLAIGVLVGYAITMIVFLAYAMLITYTELSERSLPLVVALTTVLSVIVAGFDAAKGAPGRGWLWGMGAGLFYVLFMAIMAVIMLPDFAATWHTFMVVMLSLAGGAVGGILGINLKTR
jgi:putative membrane protein (TIGR04086 family)